MTKKISQEQRILNELRKNGQVSRNACIRGDYGEIITRLSSIILNLRKEGMDIETKEFNNPTETIYILKDKPKEIKRYFVNGVEVAPPKYIW